MYVSTTFGGLLPVPSVIQGGETDAGRGHDQTMTDYAVLPDEEHTFRRSTHGLYPDSVAHPALFPPPSAQRGTRPFNRAGETHIPQIKPHSHTTP